MYSRSSSRCFFTLVRCFGLLSEFLFPLPFLAFGPADLVISNPCGFLVPFYFAFLEGYSGAMCRGAFGAVLVFFCLRCAV